MLTCNHSISKLPFEIGPTNGQHQTARKYLTNCIVWQNAGYLDHDIGESHFPGKSVSYSFYGECEETPFDKVANHRMNNVKNLHF